jgi:hypothetical protein
VMVLQGESSIREVIPFPKTQTGSDHDRRPDLGRGGSARRTRHSAGTGGAGAEGPAGGRLKGCRHVT